MKIIIVNKLWSNTIGITIFPFIFIRKDRVNEITITHEKTHIAQQKELLVIFFYLLYCLEYLIKFIYYSNLEKAYYSISFEREAYLHESNSSYLVDRKWYAFLKHIYYKNG